MGFIAWLTFAAVRGLLILSLFVLYAFGTNAQAHFCVDSIIFEGDFRTKDALLTRELNFKEKDCIPSDSLNQYLQLAEKRLFNTQLFNKVKADTVVIAGQQIVRFYLDERFPVFPKPNLEFADRNFNVWWQEQGAKLNRLNLGLGLIHQNVRGRREQLGIEGQIGYTRKFALSYNMPFLDRQQKHGIGASIAVFQNMEVAYKTESNKLLFKRFEDKPAFQQTAFAFWYNFRPAFATNHNFQLSLRRLSVHDSIAAWLNPDYLGHGVTKATVIGFSYRVDYNGVDNWNYPLEGFRAIGSFSADYQLGAKFLPSLHWQADWYQQIAPKWYYNFIIRGRKAFGKDLPYYMQKNMGYDFDEMRGYEYFVHDGTFFNILRGNLKYKLVDQQIKLPIRYFRYIPIRIFAKGYSDLGYTFAERVGTNTLNNKLLYSYGIGLDIVTLYDIRIRLEYTINDKGLRGLYLHKSGE